MLGNLTLEELIAAKLEISSRTNISPIYGVPIWKHLQQIVEDATLMFAISVTQTPTEAATFLGMTPYNFKRLIRKYNMYTYFNRNFDKLVKEKAEREKNDTSKKTAE